MAGKMTGDNEKRTCEFKDLTSSKIVKIHYGR